jgi:very-short-patch-repair endonuclease
MRHVSPGLAHQISIHHGIVKRSALVADGFSHNTVGRLVASGVLVPVHHGAYRVATAPDTFEARCVAACFADPSAVITGLAAGRLWAFRHVIPVDVPEVLVAHHANPISTGVTLRRTNQLSREDVVQRRDGIRVASPPRAWFDCAVHLDDQRFEMLTEYVLDTNCRVPTLWRTVRRFDARGRRGLARARRVLSARSVWQKPADSGLELRVLKALQRAGLPELVRQHPIRLANNSIAHADGAIPDLRWAVEIDHITWHGGRFDAQHDKSRDRAARRAGWQIERITDQALREDFRGEIASVVDMYHCRVADRAARPA